MSDHARTTAPSALPGGASASESPRDVLDVPTARDRARHSASGPRLVPALTIAAHPYAERVGARLNLDAVVAGSMVELSRKQPDFALPGQTLGAPLGDPFISRKPIRIGPAADGGVRLHLDSDGTDMLIVFHFARQQLHELKEADVLAPTDPYAQPWMPAEVAIALLRYPWPGNIRQLRNVARQLVIEHRGGKHLRPAGLGPELSAHMDENRPQPLAPKTAHTDSSARVSPLPANRRRKPTDIGEAELVAALRASAWDFKAAADRLGISRSSIYDLVKRCPSVRTAGDLGVDEITECHRRCAGDLDAMARELQVSRRALGRRVKELGLSS